MSESELRAAVAVALRERPGRLEDVAQGLLLAQSDEWVREALAVLIQPYMRRVARASGIQRGRLARRPGGLSAQLCECGCGEFTKISPRSRPEKGWVRGEARRFVSGHAAGVSLVQWVVDASGCWIWQRTTKNGYGIVEVGGRRLRAHRWVYERETGDVLGGLDLHHECRNRRCVNPDHLRPLSRSDHRRLHAAGR